MELWEDPRIRNLDDLCLPVRICSVGVRLVFAGEEKSARLAAARIDREVVREVDRSGRLMALKRFRESQGHTEGPNVGLLSLMFSIIFTASIQSAVVPRRAQTGDDPGEARRGNRLMGQGYSNRSLWLASDWV